MVSIIGSRRQINKIQRTTYCIFTGTSDGFHTPQSNKLQLNTVRKCFLYASCWYEGSTIAKKNKLHNLCKQVISVNFSCNNPYLYCQYKAIKQ